MVTVSNVFLVHNVAVNTLGAKAPLQQLTIALFKLSEIRHTMVFKKLSSVHVKISNIVFMHHVNV